MRTAYICGLIGPLENRGGELYMHSALVIESFRGQWLWEDCVALSHGELTHTYSYLRDRCSQVATFFARMGFTVAYDIRGIHDIYHPRTTPPDSGIPRSIAYRMHLQAAELISRHCMDISELLSALPQYLPVLSLPHTPSYYPEAMADTPLFAASAVAMQKASTSMKDHQFFGILAREGLQDKLFDIPSISANPVASTHSAASTNSLVSTVYGRKKYFDCLIHPFVIIYNKSNPHICLSALFFNEEESRQWSISIPLPHDPKIAFHTVPLKKFSSHYSQNAHAIRARIIRTNAKHDNYSLRVLAPLVDALTKALYDFSLQHCIRSVMYSPRVYSSETLKSLNAPWDDFSSEDTYSSTKGYARLNLEEHERLWAASMYAHIKENEEQKVIYVATDASLNVAKKHGAIAWVSETGDCGASFSKYGSVHLAEEAAIRLAMDHYLNMKDQSYDRIIILTDSKSACNSCIKAFPYHPIFEFRWVRGHNGHPLNEAANRLAISFRRCYEFKVSDNVRIQQQNTIIADMKNEWEKFSIKNHTVASSSKGVKR